MLAVADCTVAASPFFGEKLVTAERFHKFRKGSRFVSIAQGMLVDENALIGLLKSDHPSL
jgi:phosphoglycerate dehydrogenase-like enzyme